MEEVRACGGECGGGERGGEGVGEGEGEGGERGDEGEGVSTAVCVPESIISVTQSKRRYKGKLKRHGKSNDDDGKSEHSLLPHAC